MNLDETMLHNLLVERELCIAKIEFAVRRLEQLEAQIAELREKAEGVA